MHPGYSTVHTTVTANPPPLTISENHLLQPISSYTTATVSVHPYPLQPTFATIYY